MADTRGEAAVWAPVHERIESLDVLRGIAILFILFMNMPGMAYYQPQMNDPRLVSWAAGDQAGFALVMTLQGTQRGLLEILFGAGIMILTRQATMPDGPVGIADLHYRRNLLLILFGLFNGLVLLWSGDVLLPYGLAALLLFHCRLWRPRVQIGLAAVFLSLGALPQMLHYVERVEARAAAAQLEQAKDSGAKPSQALKEKAEIWHEALRNQVPVAQNPEKRKEMAEVHSRRTGPLPSYVVGAWNDWLLMFGTSGFFPTMAEIVGTMLLGMALFQLGFVQGRARRFTYLAVLLVGYGTGLTLRVLGLAEIMAFTPKPKLWWVTHEFARLGLTLGHIALVHLVLGSAAGRRLLAPFQAAGRMPLTVYLFTSFLAMWVLFPGFGFGLHGRWGYGGMVACAAVIVAAELIAADLWMRRFATGPLEWLWKSLAYGRTMPFRRRAEAG